MSKLDLHGIKHEDVDRIVENFVLLETPPLTIICGNSDKMIRLVQEVLDRSPESFSKMAKFVKDQGFKTLKCAPFDECKSPFSTPGLPKEAKIGLSRISSVIEWFTIISSC